MKNKNRRHTIKDPPTRKLWGRKKWRKTRRTKMNVAEKKRTANDGTDEYPVRGADASSYYNMSAWYDLLNSPPLYHGS